MSNEDDAAEPRPSNTIVIGIGSSHLRRIDRASPRRIKKMAAGALRKACCKCREQGGQPLTAVDDLTMHAIGPWVDVFAEGLVSAAIREKISIVGGEMAQMKDSYSYGYVGVIVYVAGIGS